MSFNDKLKQVFAKLDKDGSNTIPIEDLCKALRIAGMNPTENQIEEYSKTARLINSKFLDFNEFERIALWCSMSGRVSKEEVFSFFSAFDCDKKGYLTSEELKKALCEQGDKLDSVEIQVILKDFDREKQGRIYVEELVDGLLNDSSI